MDSPSQRGSTPAGYREFLYWRLTDRSWRMVVMQVLSLPLFASSAVGFFWLAFRFGKLPDAFSFGSALYLLVLILGAFLTLIIHELVHGAAMQLFGAHPRYGVLWKQFIVYATSPGYAFTRTQYLVTILAPLVGLSLLSISGIWILAGSPWVLLFVLMAAINVGGSVGDLWISILVLRYPAHTYVVDERDGMRILLPEDSPVIG